VATARCAVLPCKPAGPSFAAPGEPLSSLDALQGQTGGKHCQKSQSVGKLRDAVGQGDETESQELIQPDGFLVMGAQIEHQFADHRAKQSANAETARQPPEDIDGEPSPAGDSEIVQTKQTETEKDEREGGAVVQPALAGQAEAQQVTVSGLVDLDVRRQHRVGRRQNAPDQDGSAQR
jgi:hypothetical protein